MDIRIGKADVDLSVDVGALTPDYDDFHNLVKASPRLEYVIRYGLTQMLNDAHSAVTRDTDPDVEERKAKCLAMAQKKLDALVAGTIRQSSGRSGDAVAVEAQRLAKRIIRAAWTAAGKKLKDLDETRERVAIANYLEKHPELVDQARANVESAKALAEDVVI